MEDGKSRISHSLQYLFRHFFDVTIMWYVVINRTATVLVRWEVSAAQGATVLAEQSAE